MDNNQLKAFVLLLEWDGDKPPTQWYQRLAKFGIKVRRGDKNQSPVERRQFETSGKAFSGWDENLQQWVTTTEDVDEFFAGTVAQEGVIISQSESLIRTLAQIARTMTPSPKSIFTGTIDVGTYAATEGDLDIMKRVNNILQRKGRPSDTSKMSYYVTCIEEGVGYQVDDVTGIICCPNCSATNVLIRYGVGIILRNDDKLSNFQNWLRSRFMFGKFEIPNISTSGGHIPTSPAKIENEEYDLVTTLSKSKIKNKIDNLPTDVALRALDAIFITRRYIPKKDRDDKRARLAVELIKAGWSISEVQIFEQEEPDVIDLAAFGDKYAKIVAAAVRSV